MLLVVGGVGDGLTRRIQLYNCTYGGCWMNLILPLRGLFPWDAAAHSVGARFRVPRHKQCAGK